MNQFNLGWIPLIQQELRKFFASKNQGDKADTALQPGAIGTTVQGYDANLENIANLTTTTFGRSLLTQNDAATAQSALGLVPGTDIQPYDADLTALAALATTGLIDRTGAGTATTRTTNTTGLAVLASANEAAARTAIGSPAFAGDSTATITTNSVIRSQIDSSGNVASTIPGGSTLLPEFKCRAWVNFDGTTTPPTVRASGNVSSVTKDSTGTYTVNFSTAMPDANYSAAVDASDNSTNLRKGHVYDIQSGRLNCKTINLNNLAVQDTSNVKIAIFR